MPTKHPRRWPGLCDHAHYDLVTATRGCDTQGDVSVSSHALDLISDMKFAVTSRIRALVFGTVSPFYESQYLTKGILASLNSHLTSAVSTATKPPGLAHYTEHLIAALNGSHDHEIWGGLGPQLKSFLFDVHNWRTPAQHTTEPPPHHDPE